MERLAATFLTNPVQINIGSTDQLHASKSVTQHIHMVGGPQKWEKLTEIMAKMTADAKVILFAGTKIACDDIANKLWGGGCKCDSIHGDKDQYTRTKVLNAFKNGDLSVLVATDVAARGLDVKDVSHVINYDFPSGHGGVEDYVHRIGRTGRAGNP